MNVPGGSPSSEGKAKSLVEVLSQKVVGQAAVMECIVPAVQMHLAGLAPAGRPAGVFLLLGPTGTGKTRTVEALAEVLHGSAKNLLKINCGEFQLDHEVAKLIGAPPGYIGHRETSCILSENNLQAVRTECDLAIVLFDEIEKAAPALTRLLLGLLDKGTVRLGDNVEVDFENSLIFFTSNLGAREMMKEIQPGMGFRHTAPSEQPGLAGRLERVSLAAVRHRFSPEFVNRIDAVITYHPLDTQSFSAIMDQQVVELQNHVNTRLGDKRFEIAVSEEARQFLLKRGTSPEYGARELKRVIHRYLTQPLATYVVEGKIPAGSEVKIGVNRAGDNLAFDFVQLSGETSILKPTILIVDDNIDLLRLLALSFKEKTDGKVITADSAKAANEAISSELPHVALLDWTLPDGNGITIGVNLKRKNPDVKVIIMTGAELPDEERALCAEYGLYYLPKPFLANQALNLVQEKVARAATARG